MTRRSNARHAPFRLILAAGLLLPLAACTGPRPFRLAHRGQPAARIVTGTNAPETVRFAARELQTYVRRMSGAELPIAETPAPGTPSIRLGPAAREALPAGPLAAIRRDGYWIAATNGDLCVVGIDEAGPRTDIEALLARGVTHDMPAWDFQRGTLYGVYRLLEALGVRWFLPGAFGERVPRAPTLLFAGAIREDPHFVSRMVGYWSLWIGNNFQKDLKKLTILPGERAAIGFTPAENRLWELRMRGATFQIPLNHYPQSTRWVERFGQAHPEYFALLPDGSRCNGSGFEQGHLCYSEPGVVRESVADIRAYAAGEPSEARGISRIHPITKQPLYESNRGWPDHVAYGGHVSLLPHDGFRPCVCSNCAARVSRSGVPGEEHSRQVWPYVARCAEQVPETKVTCLAYGSYHRPYPGMPPLPPNVVVGFCAFSHPASLYYKDTFAQYERAVADWAALAHGNLAYWQHYLASNRDEETVGMPEHTPAMVARVVRVMARHGNHAFCEMLADSIQFELFNRYLLLKLFYDPTLDERALFEDFIERFYGPEAGPAIGAIYDDIEAKCIERFRTRAAGYGVWEKLFGAATLRGYQARAEEARRKAAGTLYEPAVAAFEAYYLGLMERGRSRFADPLANLLAEFNPVLASRATAAAPVLDGVLDEPAWKAAEPVTLGNTVNGKATRRRTEVRFCHDATHLYVGARVAAAPADAGPGAVDAIAVYLDPAKARQGYYRVTADRSGAVRDYRYIDHIQLGAPDWRSGARAAVAEGPDGYGLELAIPFEALGVAAGGPAGAEWGALAARTQAAPSEPQDRESTSSLLLRGKLEQPGVFNALRFKTP